jgi:predicted metal-dependent peptidase
MVQQFDYGLQGEAIPIQRMGKVNVAVMGRGGTSLGPVIGSINEQSPDLAIISTDGGLEHKLMPRNGVHVVWILTHDGHAPPWGTVIRLPPPKAARR